MLPDFSPLAMRPYESLSFLWFFDQPVPRIPSNDVGRKFFVHEKAGVLGNSKAIKVQKNAPNQTVRSISCYILKKLTLQGLLNSHSHGMGLPTMGEQCGTLRMEIPATCRWQVATLPMVS